MKRMMSIKDVDVGILVTFTDTHLPRTVGKAIKRAYDGELDIQFGGQPNTAHVYWRRED